MKSSEIIQCPDARSGRRLFLTGKQSFLSAALPAAVAVARLGICCLFLLASGLFTSCELEDQPEASGDLPGLTEAGCQGLWILSEGLMNLNNSSLAYYSFEQKTLEKTKFRASNKRGLGDTGNDLKAYGSKLYVVVTVSSQLEVLDLHSGLSIKRIPLFDENQRARQPRYIDFLDGKAYVCSFDGSLARIDTASLEVEAYVDCGRNPDGICIANNKIYVANSGGLDNPNFDNSISVVDPLSFKEIKRIESGLNPYRMQVDSQGDIYVVIRGNLSDQSFSLSRIDSRLDSVVQVFPDIPAWNLTIHKDTAYIYNYSEQSGQNWIMVFDCLNEELVSDQFIQDETLLSKPYAIDVNPYTGDVYICDAHDYTLWGDCLCFSKDGKLKFRFKSVGLNPNSLVFVK
ncbi:MAG: hypothetical protein M0P23_01830 [Bacteroidales bacterium]|nr:hypothetical protein [Bacteroidales bacterium]